MEREKKEKIQQIAAQPDIQQKIAEIEKNGEPTTAVILDFWKEQGIELTEADLDDLVQEISDDELDDVVGGVNVQRKVKVQTHAALNAEASVESAQLLNNACNSVLGFSLASLQNKIGFIRR